jgi:hypothetical protein
MYKMIPPEQVESFRRYVETVPVDQWPSPRHPNPEGAFDAMPQSLSSKQRIILKGGVKGVRGRTGTFLGRAGTGENLVKLDSPVKIGARSGSYVLAMDQEMDPAERNALLDAEDQQEDDPHAQLRDFLANKGFSPEEIEEACNADLESAQDAYVSEEEYAPYNKMPAFKQGVKDYQAGKMRSPYSANSVEGQAYDRGQEYAMKMQREDRDVGSDDPPPFSGRPIKDSYGRSLAGKEHAADGVTLARRHIALDAAPPTISKRDRPQYVSDAVMDDLFSRLPALRNIKLMG